MEFEQLRKIYVQADEVKRTAENIQNHELYTQLYNRGHQLQEIVQDQLRHEGFTEEDIWNLTVYWLIEQYNVTE